MQTLEYSPCFKISFNELAFQTNSSAINAKIISLLKF